MYLYTFSPTQSQSIRWTGSSGYLKKLASENKTIRYVIRSNRLISELIITVNTNWGGRLSTDDLLIKAICVKEVNNIFSKK